MNDKNFYKHYVKQFDYGDTKVTEENKKPVHKYTIEIHRAVYTDEFWDVYHKYELAIHKKERDKS